MTQELFSDEEFGRRLREVRQKAGMRQEDLAEAVTAVGMKMHRSTIGKIELAERPATVTEAFYLAKVMGIELADLLEKTIAEQVDSLKDVIANKHRQILTNRRMELSLKIKSLQRSVEEAREIVYTATASLTAKKQELAEALEESNELDRDIEQFQLQLYENATYTNAPYEMRDGSGSYEDAMRAREDKDK